MLAIDGSADALSPWEKPWNTHVPSVFLTETLQSNESMMDTHGKVEKRMRKASLWPRKRTFCGLQGKNLLSMQTKPCVRICEFNVNNTSIIVSARKNKRRQPVWLLYYVDLMRSYGQKSELASMVVVSCSGHRVLFAVIVVWLAEKLAVCALARFCSPPEKNKKAFHFCRPARKTKMKTH